MGEVGPATPDTSSFATKGDISALNQKIPSGASSAPPPVADASEKGSDGMVYALANHTHASKVRKARATTAADGSYTWVFDPPFPAGTSPRVLGQAITSVGVTDVFNVQTEGAPTNTQAKVRVNRTSKSVVALLGLTILSVPASTGAVVIDLFASEP